MLNMSSSLFLPLRGTLMCALLLFSSGLLLAQETRFENYDIKPVLVNMSIATIFPHLSGWTIPMASATAPLN
jgi:hypothetical protein